MTIMDILSILLPDESRAKAVTGCLQVDAVYPAREMKLRRQSQDCINEKLNTNPAFSVRVQEIEQRKWRAYE
jgi:hypothetical protein